MCFRVEGCVACFLKLLTTSTCMTMFTCVPAGASWSGALHSPLQLPSQLGRVQTGPSPHGRQCGGAEAPQPGCWLSHPHGAELCQGWIPSWHCAVRDRSAAHRLHHCTIILTITILTTDPNSKTPASAGGVASKTSRHGISA